MDTHNVYVNMQAEKPLILFIDAYDSFSNNIISLLEKTLHATVRTIKIDSIPLASDQNFRDELKYYTAVVCGPGPGHPVKQRDVGIMTRIWELSEQDLVPVLGICLGFQSLCVAFGGRVDKLQGPQHGIVRKVTHVGHAGGGDGSIFDGVGEMQATLYQSLHADIGHYSMSRATFQERKWDRTEQCPDLVPLAWAEWDGNVDNDSGMRDDNILVAVRHRTKPFWALQYHPESICTTEESGKVIENWFVDAQAWNVTSRHKALKPFPQHDFTHKAFGQPVVRRSLLSENESQSLLHSLKPDSDVDNDESLMEVLDLHLDEVYRCKTLKLPKGMSAPDILELIQDTGRDQMILDSSNFHEISAHVRGKYSIIALEVDEALRFDYVAGQEGYENKSFRAGFNHCVGGYRYASLDPKSSGGVWPFLAQFVEKRRISDGNIGSPFWGGFMGYTSYEMGLERIGVTFKLEKSRRLDLCLVWVTRSLVLDHERGLIYLQDVSKESSEGMMPAWMQVAFRKLNALSLPQTSPGVLQYRSRDLRETSEKRRRFSDSSLSSVEGSNLENLIPSSVRIAKTPTAGSLPILTATDLAGLAILSAPYCTNYVSTGRTQPTKGDSSNSSLFQAHVSDSTYSQPSSDSSSRSSLDSNPEPSTTESSVAVIKIPSIDDYESKVRRCQSYIEDGESYELCLTDQTSIQRHRFDRSWDGKAVRYRQISAPDSNLSPAFYKSHDGSRSIQGDAWSLYRKLREQQPAPFASFIRLGHATLISSSPERFLKWTAEGDCELRPMKGTVRKSYAVSSLESAKALLNVPKEKAENLMIVDLVRHDLHGICGSGNVSVPRLMVVEEYKSVFQMITVVQGRIPMPGRNYEDYSSGRKMRHRHTGLDVLAASLPPGSMTGAPKKRSCEILQAIEDKPRSLYSGLVGYMDIGGRGDWSVTIRSMFRWDDEDVPEGDEKEGLRETWHIGAGGAVTALSTPKGERDEMLTKLNGTLGVFR